MSEELSISIQDVTKCYHIYDNPRDRLKQLLAGGRRRYFREFWALKGISFEVGRGETVGLVGRNGSGKSTLLQIIAGTLSATAGRAATRGRVAALLELGSGFNPDFSGRQNVHLNAALLGLSREEVAERFDAIAEFADIGDFMDQPVKTYSSGMMVRLAFAVQAQVEPDVLIVDEALAVGDVKFQAKCFDRLNQLKANGTSILLVTHSSEQIVTHCSKAVLLDQGQVLESGAPRMVVNRYLDLLFGRERVANEARNPSEAKLSADQAAPGGSDASEAADEDGETQASARLAFEHDGFVSRVGYNPYEYRWGDGTAAITDFHLQSDTVEYPSNVRCGAPLALQVAVRFERTLLRPIFGFTLKTKEGVTVYGTNSELLQLSDADAVGQAGQRVVLKMQFDCDLAPGDYFISLGIATREGEEVIPHDRRYDSIHLSVQDRMQFFGLADLKLKMHVDTAQP